MSDENEMDETTKLVLEVVEKVLDQNDEASGNSLYPAWSANDGTWNPRGSMTSKGETAFKGRLDFWSRYTEGTGPNIKQIERLNAHYANSIQVRKKYCSFCKRNGESLAYYSTHSLYENGRVSCPVLRECKCTICGQKGHTLSHCPNNSTKMSVLKLIHRCNSMQSI